VRQQNSGAVEDFILP